MYSVCRSGVRRACLALAMVAAGFGATSSAQAGFISGTQGVALVGGSGNTGLLATDTSFNNVTLMTTFNQTGDYTGFAVTILPAVTLDLSNPNSFTFGNAEFGTFQTTSFNELAGAPTARNFEFIGTFTPGTAFPGSSQNSARFILQINQVGGASTAYGGGGTLQTPAPSNTPEPATLVMLGTVAGPMAFGWMRRRRTAK